MNVKTWILAVTLGGLLTLGGCSGGQKPAENEGTTGSTAASGGKGGPGPVEGDFKVALLTPSPVSDAGWSAMAYDGLKAIETDLNATINTQEARDTQIKDAMRSYANQGYQLIIGHGFEYNAPGVELAKDFPKTVFVSSSGDGTAPNAGAFRFYLEQGCYLAGMMAGLMTKSGVVAMIGGPKVPSIASTFKAFKAGAESVKPGIRVIETYTGQNADIAAAKRCRHRGCEAGDRSCDRGRSRLHHPPDERGCTGRLRCSQGEGGVGVRDERRPELQPDRGRHRQCRAGSSSPVP